MDEALFQYRLKRHIDELRWLYMELYEPQTGADAGSMFEVLLAKLHEFAMSRPDDLKMRDLVREQSAIVQNTKHSEWYKSNALLGMMLYIDNFAGNLNGVREKLSWLEATGVNLLHLMPFLNSPKGRSDGGYAVSDFRTVRPDLGTMDDLSALTLDCHQRGINVCMDFVMNHTSEEHEWAKRARAGDPEYKSRYFFFDDDVIPNEYEKTVPQVFPTSAPGNFTWLDDCKQYVMTTFYPYQWDLNYSNPRVFNEMVCNYLFLANRGMDIIRIDAVPYIWKQLGTNCRNLPKVHTIVRMMRMIGEIVCPSVILLGEVVMEPVRVVPYFGTIDKPECHLLYNVTTMCTTWNTVATRDVRLLKKQLDTVNALPREYVFLNYLRCHDDIGWGLDYATLKNWGMEEVPHKHYLNEYFLGHTPGSTSRGELYNDDPSSGDARFCGTTASLCGIETALATPPSDTGDNALELAIRFDLTLHAMMLMQSGIPMLYSGDEIAQINDYSYKQDPDRAADSRHVHRGKFRWDLAQAVGEAVNAQDETDSDDPVTATDAAVAVFRGLKKLTELRKNSPAFRPNADVWTLEVLGSRAFPDKNVLAIGRYADGQKIIGVFNFSPTEKIVSIEQGLGDPATFNVLLSTGTLGLCDAPATDAKAPDEPRSLYELVVPAYGFYYLGADL